MYRYVVGSASSKLIAAELSRADQRPFRSAAEPAPAAREATEAPPPVTVTATRRRPRWIVRALRLAH